ncbi:MAG: hypothetical protein ACTHNK_17155 [Thermomicrobiales bacterium]
MARILIVVGKATWHHAILPVLRAAGHHCTIQDIPAANTDVIILDEAPDLVITGTLDDSSGAITRTVARARAISQGAPLVFCAHSTEASLLAQRLADKVLTLPVTRDMLLNRLAPLLPLTARQPVIWPVTSEHQPASAPLHILPTSTEHVG